MRKIDTFNLTLLMWGVFVIAVMVLMSIAGNSSAEQSGRARCDSLQGEYGGGKCFKDGREM